MSDVGLALAAGMLAAVNPCGFALLPAYLSFLVLGDDQPARTAAVARALLLTGAMTLGFAAVFGLFGLVVAPVAGSVQRHLPWFTIGLGLLLVGLGGWLLAGRKLPALVLPGTRRGGRGGPITRSVPSMVAVGASYAVASLGCTIGPFLVIVVSSFRAGSTWNGVALFLAYALGMGLLIGIAAVAVALARTSTVGRLRRIGAAGSRLAGGLLVVVGGYVAYYGWYEIRIFAGGTGDDPVVSAAGEIQRWLSGRVEDVGFPVVAAVFGLLALGGLGLGVHRRRSPRRAAR